MLPTRLKDICYKQKFQVYFSQQPSTKLSSRNISCKGSQYHGNEFNLSYMNLSFQALMKYVFCEKTSIQTF